MWKPFGIGYRYFDLPVWRGFQPSGKTPVFDLHSTYEEIPTGGIPAGAEELQRV
jgi:hypothetical protein